ncbi:MAG: DMT family transporter [Lentisphaeria bacterium]|nr:DMT family transporter [Lentisphaeria bacterium]
MSFGAFFLILLSVFLHAGWNFLSKAHRPSAAFYLLVNAVPAVLLLPFAGFAEIEWTALGWKFWLAFAGSWFGEVLYAIGLFRAYRKQDISVAYPLVRALPVLMVAAVTMIFRLGEMPGMTAWIGFVVVVVGCVILPQQSWGKVDWRGLLSAICGPILLAAAGTTAYTVMDSTATGILREHSLSGRVVTLCAFFGVMEVAISAALAGIVLTSRRERLELSRNLLTPWAYLSGVFSALAYLLVLAAMGMVSNVSFLQAFRQMSLPLGVAAGVVFLHEKLSATKVFGTVMIVAGLILSVL